MGRTTHRFKARNISRGDMKLLKEADRSINKGLKVLKWAAIYAFGLQYPHKLNVDEGEE